MPIHIHGVLLHTMSETELSRVRTELQRRRILPTIPPHPIQANRESSPYRSLGNTFVPTHRQVNVPTSPVRMDARCCLGRLHQQEAQQGTALLTDVSQSLLASTGVLTRNHSHVRANLLAPLEASRSSDDQHIGECGKRTDTGVGHESQNLGSLPGF